MTGDDPEDTSASDLASVLDQLDSAPNPQLALARLLVERAAVTDPDFADAIRYCAIPRRLDARIVGVLRGSDDADANRRILKALQGTGFLQPRRDGGYVYHDSIRDALMEEWRDGDARDRFRELNGRLARLYDEERGEAFLVARAWNLSVDVVKRASEERFTQLSGRIEGLALAPMIEALYHRTLASPDLAFGVLQDDLQFYERLGRFALCEALLNAAADFFARQRTRDSPELYQQWLDYWRARLAKAAGRRDEAEETLRGLLRRVEGPDDGPLKLRLWALDLLAGVLTEAHRYPEALRLCRQVLELRESTGEDPRNLPAAYLDVAELHRRLGDYDRAETHFRSAIASADRARHGVMAVSSRLGLSGMLYDAGDAAQAWELALDATIRARTTDVLGASDVQREVAEAILGLGCSTEPWLMDTVRAECRGMLGALGSSLLLLSLESTYVEHLMCGGQLDRAAAALSDLMELAQIASSDRRGQIALQCGRLAQARGSLDAAHELYGEALLLAGVPGGSDLLEILALRSRGQLAVLRGRWTDATADLRRCLTRAATLGHQAIALSVRLELASLYQQRGDLGRAAGLADRVHRALRGTRSALAARCHRVSGDVCRSAGRFDEAVEHYRKANEHALAFDRQDEAAAAAAALAGVASRQGRWREAAAWTQEAARLTERVAAMAEYRPSPEAAAADGDNAVGLGHLFTSGGVADGEIRVARDWFLAAAEQLPGRPLQAAWYRLNLAFAHRLLREQREAVEALAAVVATQEGWTRSRALYRLFAEWGAEHGRTLLRDGDARRAWQRFKSTIDVVRGAIPVGDVLRLACGHVDALVALDRDEEAHAELQSVLEQAAAGDDVRAQVSARVRLALAASTPVERRLEHVQRCLDLRSAGDHARGTDQLVDVIDELVDLRLPAAAYHRLRGAIALTAAAAADPAEKELLGRCALRLAAGSGWPGSSPAQTTPVVLALDPALVERVPGGSGMWRLVERSLPEVVERVAAELGVPRVPATVRSDADLTSGAYAIEVRQTVAVRGRVRTGGRFHLGLAPGPGGWPARDPLTGRPGVWLAAGGPAGAGAWSPLRFVLRHVEAVLREQVAAFLDLEAVHDLLSRWRAGGRARLPACLDGRDGALLLFQVLRMLLDEGVPVVDVDTIVSSFRTIESHPADVQHVVERVRLALAPRIPGADGSREIVELSRRVETALGRHVRTVDGKTFLALPPEQARMHRDAVRLLLAGREPRATMLRVRNRSLRPFVRRLTERALPSLAVVSAAELARARLDREAGWS
jgi:tetratricopeptide (TPR) repeat protein